MPETLSLSSFLGIIFGVIVAATGVLAIAVHIARWKHRDVGLAAFGATSFLYGIRLLLESQVGHRPLEEVSVTLIHAIAVITYLLPIPLSGFLLHLFGKGWKNTMLWAFRFSIPFAAGAISWGLVDGDPFAAMTLNNILVLAWACIIIVNASWPGLRKTREIRLIIVSFVFFLLFVINANLVGLDVLPWQWRDEVPGFLIFLFTLGFVAVRRFFDSETRLYSIERELAIARRIQASLLPRRMPESCDIRIAARCVPATSVGGDFYDILEGDDSHFCVLVADVSGHGIGAALIASMLKVAFASQSEHISDPAMVLSGINTILTGKLEGNFVTAGCIWLDVQTRCIRYAGAGHPLPLFSSSLDGRLEEIDANGTILGAFTRAEYHSVERSILPGDRIILYTDGIVEACDTTGNEFGMEGFKAFLRSNDLLPAEVLAESLLSHLHAFTGKHSAQSRDDDVTVLIIDVGSRPGSPVRTLQSDT